MHEDQKLSSRSFLRITCAFAALVFAGAAIVQGQSQATGNLATSRAREEAVTAKFLRVSEIFSFAGITPGAKVADIGAGEGWLTVRLARAVGPSGRVYAVDIAARALKILRERVREEGLNNVEVVEGAVDDPRLPRESLDAAITILAYHEMSAYDAMLRHIRESLKPTGRLVLVEPTSRLVASDREAQRRADVLSAQLAEDDLRKAGFHIAELRDPFVTELGGRYLIWLIVAHRAPGILHSPVPPAGRGPLPPDGREVVTPPGKSEDIKRADLRMSADEVQKRVSTGGATIVDLRSDAEYRSGHIRGAISVLVPGEFDAKLGNIASRGGPVFLYCS
jgi:FkbM family methyltransferase